MKMCHNPTNCRKYVVAQQKISKKQNIIQYWSRKPKKRIGNCVAEKIYDDSVIIF